jgi:hypothetical protein
MIPARIIRCLKVHDQERDKVLMARRRYEYGIITSR